MTSNPLSDFSSRTASDKGEERVAGGLMDSAGEDFPHLRSLNIGRTTTKSQEALDEVRQCQCLVSIQLHGIACAEIISNAVKFYLLLASYENLYSPSKHGRQQTISNTNEIKQL